MSVKDFEKRYSPTENAASKHFGSSPAFTSRTIRDVTLHHHVIHQHNLCPAVSLARKN